MRWAHTPPMTKPASAERGSSAGSSIRVAESHQVEVRPTPLSIEEAAGFLGVTVRWMRRAVRDRRLAYYKVGHYLRFRVEDLEAFLAAGRVEPTPVVMPLPGLGPPIPIRPIRRSRDSRPRSGNSSHGGR